MENGAFQNRVVKKEPQAEMPGAKVRASDGHPRQAHQAQGSALELEEKNPRTVVGSNGGRFLERAAEKFVGRNTNKSFDEVRLPALGRNDLIRAWQCTILRFPIKQCTAEQDATRQAVENQRNGDNAASLLAAVNQARANPRVRAELAKLIGIPGHYADPDFMEAWDNFMEFYARQHQIAEDGPAEACDSAMVDLFGETR